MVPVRAKYSKLIVMGLAVTAAMYLLNTLNYSSRELPKSEVIHVAIAACGAERNRQQELVALVKSCVIFAQPYGLHFHIFATPEMKEFLHNSVNSWPANAKSNFIMDFYTPKFPNTKWEKLYRPCSSLRLFMPFTLPTYVTRVIYMDTDSLVTGPLINFWNEFEKFNDVEILGMSLESVEEDGWYDKHQNIPIPLKHGVNAGIILMKIGKIRENAELWKSEMTAIAERQKSSNLLGDQDILNEYLHLHTFCLYVFSCQYNFRPNFCQNSKNRNGCPDSRNNGISVLHGSNFALHNQSSAYHHVFKVFQSVNFEKFTFDNFLTDLRKIKYMANFDSLECAHVFPELITKQLKKV